MPEVTNDLIFEVLKTVQADMRIVKESIRRLDARVATLDAYMSAFHNKAHWQTDEIDAIRGRLDALEDTDTDIQ